jgi:hypothetical protein
VAQFFQACATSRKIADSISDGVTVIFDLLDLSGCTMTLVSTQPLIEMNTSDICWG